MSPHFNRRSGACIAALAAALCACRADRRGESSNKDTSVAATPVTDSSAASPNTGPCGVRLWTANLDTAAPLNVIRHAVNRGTAGMSSQVKWMRSPDGCSLVVMQDPAAVEAEPVPNGVLLANERTGRVFQRDSVWDAAPSPDWSRLAFGVAFGMQPRGAADSLSTAEWTRFASRVGANVTSVRRAAFSCSGMAYWFCVARLHVAEFDSGSVGAAATARGDTVRALATLAGWRVRWSADGATLFAGTGPRGSQDHNPSVRWLSVDPDGGGVRDTIAAGDTAGLAPLPWTTGPTLTYGVAIDLVARSEVSIDGAVVRSENGWIDVVWRSGTDERSFRVGPGRALAATQGGRFVAAIVAGPAKRAEEFLHEVVVYQITR